MDSTKSSEVILDSMDESDSQPLGMELEPGISELAPNNRPTLDGINGAPCTDEMGDHIQIQEDQLHTGENSEVNETSDIPALVNLDGTPFESRLGFRKRFTLRKLKILPQRLNKLFSASGPLESSPMKYPDHNADWSVLLANDPVDSLGPFVSPQLSFRRGELLLHIWTDCGPVSRLNIITGAYSIFQANYDAKQMERKIEDIKILIEFEDFCSRLNSLLDFPHRKIMTPDKNLQYRVMWTLFKIFDRSMNRKLPNYDDAIDIGLNGPTKSYGRGKSLTNVRTVGIIDTEGHMKKVLGLLNPDVTRYLSHASPLQQFIWSYGRYLQLRCREEPDLLERNPFNIAIKQSFEQFSTSLLEHRTPLPYLLEAVINPECRKMTGNRLAMKIPSRLRTALEVSHHKPCHSSARKHLTKKTQASSEIRPVTASAGAIDPVEKPVKDKVFSKTIYFFTKYEFIRETTQDMGFLEVQTNDSWNLLWSDSAVNLEHIPCVTAWQKTTRVVDGRRFARIYKINHFPGMDAIARKDGLSRSIRKMQKLFGEEFDFTPRTWTTPMDIEDLLNYSKLNGNPTFICKPNNGSQGKGISVITDFSKMSPFSNATYQTYIGRPCLIDGFKFDLRMFVLVTSVDPLIVYIYPEGLARVATVKYEVPTGQNAGRRMMHLTNTCVNRAHELYNSRKNKRKMTDVLQMLSAQGVDVNSIQKSIHDAIIKTVIAGHSELLKGYRASFPNGSPYGSICFEILGFDIILDENLKAYVLETNRAPSFSYDKVDDDAFKSAVISDTLEKIYFGPISDAEDEAFLAEHPDEIQTDYPDLDGLEVTKGFQKQFRHESLRGRNWRLVYPLQTTLSTYGKYFDTPSEMQENLEILDLIQYKGPGVRLMQQTKRPIKKPITHGVKFRRRRRPLYALKPPLWKTKKGRARYDKGDEDIGEAKPRISAKSIEIMKSEHFKNRQPIWRRRVPKKKEPEVKIEKKEKEPAASKTKKKYSRKAPVFFPGYNADMLNCPADVFYKIIAEKKLTPLTEQYKDVLMPKTTDEKIAEKEPEALSPLSQAFQRALVYEKRVARLALSTGHAPRSPRNPFSRLAVEEHGKILLALFSKPPKDNEGLSSAAMENAGNKTKKTNKINIQQQTPPKPILAKQRVMPQ